MIHVWNFSTHKCTRTYCTVYTVQTITESVPFFGALLISVQAGFEGTHNKNRASLNTGIAPIEYSRAALPWTYLIYFLIRKLSYIYVAPVANLAV